MKHWRPILVLLAIATAASAIAFRSFAQDQPSSAAAVPAGLASATTDFWTRWEGNKPSEAIRKAAPTPDYQRSWERIGRYADEFQSRLGGRCLGHVEVDRKTIGPRMVTISYLALYEPTPLRVRMLYYRARDQWNPITIRVDANPGRWMAEAEKLPVLDPADQDADPADVPDNGGNQQ